MSLMNAQQLMEKYNKGSLPSFDIGGGNVDFAEAAFIAAENAKRGMYLSSTPSTVENYLGYDGYVKVINLIAERYPAVDYAIHLDHAQDTSFVLKALGAGYSSVMYDGSHLDVKENIKNTQYVISEATKKGATVESELGIISGKEDEHSSDESKWPTLDEVKTFLQETGTCLMAPAVGTVHGHFKDEPNINWELVREITKLKGNFVIHGCTGLDNDTLKKFVNAGFVKFNFATALRESFQGGMLNYIQKNPKDIKPSAYLKAGRRVLSEYMLELFEILK